MYAYTQYSAYGMYIHMYVHLHCTVCRYKDELLINNSQLLGTT